MILFQNTLFPGRQKVLNKTYTDFIKRRLASDKLGLYIFGVPGIGKTFFIDQLEQKITKETPFSLWIRPWKENFSTLPIEWIRDFTCGVEINDKLLQSLYKKFRKNIFEKLANISNQSQLLNNWLDFWLNGLYTDVLAAIRIGNNVNTKHINLIFALDNIDGYLPIIRHNLQHILLPELKALKEMWNVHCILSGTKSIDQIFTDNNNLKNLIELLELEPVTFDDVKSCLIHKQSINDEKLLEILKTSYGNPKKIIENIYQFMGETVIKHLGFGNFTESERLLLIGLLYLIHFELGDLELFLPKGFKPEDALNWLIKLPFLKIKKEDEVYHIETKLADQLVQHYKFFYPQENSLLSQKVKTFLAKREKIPKLKDRLQLLNLAEVNYFNEKVLAEFYLHESKNILKWVENHDEWFLKSSNLTWTLSAECRYWVNLYCSILPKNFRDSLQPLNKSKLLGLWELHKSEWEKNIERNLNETQRLRQELKNIREQIDVIHQKIAKKLQALEIAKNMGKSLISLGSSTIAFFMIFMGVILLYMGVLFTQQFPLICSIGGLFLIATGFVLPYGKQKKFILEQQNRAKRQFEELKKQFFDLKQQRDYCLAQMRQMITNILACEQQNKDLKQKLKQPYLVETKLE